jgi:Ca-activated chloride channel family protein
MESLHRAFARVAALFCLVLAPATVSSVVAQESPDADSILLTVTVTDKKGDYVGGLDKSAFTVYDDKVPREVSFFDAQDEPASVGVIYDLSRSVYNTYRERLVAAGNALSRFVKLGHSANEYFVVGFADRPRLLIDWTPAEKSLPEFQGNLGRVEIEGEGTALFDACYLGIEKMKGSRHSRRAILLISDGMDWESSRTFKDVRERLRETGVLFYSIGITSHSDMMSSLATQGIAFLKELSSVSGGAAFFPESKKELNAAFDQIAAELRHQYVLGFKPPSDKADGRLHQLKVKITSAPNAPQSKLSARSRDGYYPAKTR